MAYINLSLTTKIARLNALNETIGSNATLVVYDGSYPSSPDQPAGANTLVTFPFANTAFGNVAVMSTIMGNTISNVATLLAAQIPPQFATGNGTAGWARISDTNGNAVVDLDVGVANSSTSIFMNSNNLITGIPCQVVSITIMEP